MLQKGAPSRLITSPHNARITAIRRLRGQAARDRTGFFLTEGVRFVLKAVEHHAQIETLIVAPNLLTGTVSRELVRRLYRADVPRLDVTPAVFAGLSVAERPQGVAAVVRQRWETLDRLRPDDGGTWVALEGIRNAGNLGSIIRTCDAAGAVGVLLVGDTADPHDPVAVRATMGALFAQRLARATAAELAAWARRHGVRLVGAAPAAPLSYRSASPDGPVVVLLGNEQRGLPPSLQRRCDLLVSIPMAGGADSLNVSVAAGILLYHFGLGRGSGLGAGGSASPG